VSTPFLPAASTTRAGRRPEAVGYDIVDSPVGQLALTGDDQALTGLYLLEAGARSATIQPDWARRRGSFPEAEKQLGEYFAGRRTHFDLPMAPRGSQFQLAVWAQLTRIPFGVTISYGEIALALGKTLLASRAVGLANGKNPISIIIPCHRVIGADGSMTGYGWGIERKEWLLRHEGALAATAQAALW
jgi:methylated-DNA-[protein]-cysteine S-methyltransferase